ncbi:TetR family transcriptional regulator [Streptomyces oryzae]|uniref:TetR family transcriptional regulator n=1 Tax=Streptomyces oryzae TaxID=1434886 RepID=A0ABS3X9S0_9ACTN|nr:TetR family transcriptional regulator [Streptomyces oryzae]MBO8191841.1 TetR family transcriptional regulator [Streptomyces oryzae]
MGEGLRERTRRAVRAEIAEVAIGLFVRQGFDNTTVEDIAQAAGMTKRSFFRYFATKEDVVFDGVDLTGEKVVADIAARPAEEGPWECLQHVLGAWQEEIHASEQVLATLRLIEATPALVGRLHQRRTEWRRRVSDALQGRPGVDIDAYTADLLTNAATAVLDAVSSEWVRSDGKAKRSALLEQGFRQLHVDPNLRQA